MSVSERNVPVLDKVLFDEGGGHWVLKVHGAVDVLFAIAERNAANAAWSSATRAYANGRADVQNEIKQALSIE